MHFPSLIYNKFTYFEQNNEVLLAMRLNINNSEMS